MFNRFSMDSGPDDLLLDGLRLLLGRLHGRVEDLEALLQLHVLDPQRRELFGALQLLRLMRIS